MDISIRQLEDCEQVEVKADAPEPQHVETVGDYLRKMREAKGLSLKEIAHLTKISEPYLDGIEKSDFKIIPKGPYVKGYITSYSCMIGGDTEHALGLYTAFNDDPEEAQPEMPPSEGMKSSAGKVFSTIANCLECCASILPKRFGGSDRSNGLEALAETKRALSDGGRFEKKKSMGDDDASSVLIPFKRIASPSEGANMPPAPSPAQPESPKKAPAAPSGISGLGGLGKKLIEGVGRMGSLAKVKSTKLADAHEPFFTRSFWTTLAAIALAITVLAFSSVGVYHVFFFDHQEAAAIETGSAANSDVPAPAPLPHKEPRFIKPDTPLPVITIAPVPKKPSTSLVQKPVPAPAAVETVDPAPEPITTAEVVQAPAETVVQVPVPAKEDTVQPAGTGITVSMATICSNVKDRRPVDNKMEFPLSVDRVYVWSQVESKEYPTTIHHVYYHENELINQVELPVRSPIWRTWSFKFIDKDSYRGHWHVDITTADNAQLLRRLYFEIK